MATLVLTGIGTLLGGPLGGLAGSLLGSQIDRVIFAPKGRDGPRLDDLAVQGSDYGTPLPRHYGRVRSAGTIIWSTGLKETAHRSGGGKTSGGKTTSYSYSASFAVAISARPILRVERIWADGKLLRGAAGDMRAGGAVRIYAGSETQLPDALIEAAEGAGAPAYRGRSYAVFEDLELAEYANRVPNLSFEVIADDGDVDCGRVLTDLTQRVGAAAEVDALAATMRGFSAGRNSDVASYVAALDTIEPILVTGRAGAVRFAGAGAGAVLNAEAGDLLLMQGGKRGARERGRADDLPGALSLAFADPARDYQPGVQRALRPAASGAGERHVSLPVTLEAGAAKRTAEAHLGELWSRRDAALRRLPLKFAVAEPGDLLDVAGEGVWSIRRVEFSGTGGDAELERRRGAPIGTAAADSGTALLIADVPQGPTELSAFELPPLGLEAPGMARLWLAAGGASAGWRHAELWLSLDAGTSWRSVGVASTAARMGAAVGVLPPANWSLWDETSTVEVDLIDDQLLADAGVAAVLAGANLALLGDELIQFRRAEQLAPRRFRLSGLLRGRRGTEAALASHAAGERFVLVEPEALFPLDLPLDRIGASVLVKAAGPNDPLAEVAPVSAALTGGWLRPLSPVHLAGRLSSAGDLELGWTRRSRGGFAWLDGADAPLAEESERYEVALGAGGDALTLMADAPMLVVGAAELTAAFGAPPTQIDISVAQLSATVGPGARAVATARRG